MVMMGVAGGVVGGGAESGGGGVVVDVQRTPAWYLLTGRVTMVSLTKFPHSSAHQLAPASPKNCN
jgi:hypothetical protein